MLELYSKWFLAPGTDIMDLDLEWGTELLHFRFIHETEAPTWNIASKLTYEEARCLAPLVKYNSMQCIYSIEIWAEYSRSYSYHWFSRISWWIKLLRNSYTTFSRLKGKLAKMKPIQKNYQKQRSSLASTTHNFPFHDVTENNTLSIFGSLTTGFIKTECHTFTIPNMHNESWW